MHEEDFRLCQREQFVIVHMFTCTCLSPTATQDPAADTVSGGASGQWLICSAESGRWLGHHYTSEKHNTTQHNTHVGVFGTEAKHTQV